MGWNKETFMAALEQNRAAKNKAQDIQVETTIEPKVDIVEQEPVSKPNSAAIASMINLANGGWSAAVARAALKQSAEDRERTMQSIASLNEQLASPGSFAALNTSVQAPKFNLPKLNVSMAGGSPLDAMSESVEKAKKYVNESVDPYLVAQGEETRKAFYDYLKGRVGEGELISTEDLPTPYPIRGSEDPSNPEMQISFGETTIPMDIVQGLVADYNNDILHQRQFKEDAQYRNDWFLKHAGITEKEYRNRIADHLEGRLKELKQHAHQFNTKQAEGTAGLGTYGINARSLGHKQINTGEIENALDLVEMLRKDDFSSGWVAGSDANSLFTLGILPIANSVETIAALNKANKGEKLTDSEKVAVETWEIQQEANELIETLGGRSLSSSIGEGAAASSEFIVQMLATSGYGSGVKVATGLGRAAAAATLKRIATKGTSAFMKNALKEGAIKAANSVVVSAAKVPLMPMTYKTYTDKRMGQFSIGQAEKVDTGELETVINKAPQSAWRDAMHSGLETFMEIQSEDFGQMLDWGAKSLGAGIARNMFGRSVGLSKTAPGIRNQLLRFVRQEGKISSFGSEVLSEAYGDAMVNTLEGNDKGWRQMATQDYWWQLAGVSALLSGGFSATESISNRLSNGDLRKSLNIAKQSRDKALSGVWDPELKKTLYSASRTDNLVERSRILGSIDWKDKKFDKTDVALTLDFLNAQTQLDVLSGSAKEVRRILAIQPYLDRISALQYANSGEIKAIEVSGGKTYFAQKYNDANDTFTAIDVDGKSAEIPAGDVVRTLNYDISDVIAEYYANTFRVQEQQEQLQDILEASDDAKKAGFTDDQIVEMVRKTGLTVYNPGDRVELLNGEQVTINANDGLDYEVVDDAGNTRKVAFEEVLQDNSSVAEAQRSSASNDPTALDPRPEVQQARSEAREQAEAIKNLDDDLIYQAAMGDDWETVYIVKGSNIVFDEESGDIDYDASDPTVVARDKSGTRLDISIRDLKSIDEVISVDEAASLAGEAVQVAMDTVEADTAAAEQASETPIPVVGRSLTDEEANAVISQMEANAAEAPEIELTPENWDAQFGEDGIVSTPIGEVKMGENQYKKLIQRNRSSYFGMILPTLQTPDFVLEEFDPKEEAERDTKLLFVKTFKKPDGGRYVHFESVTVKKEDREVSISSHEVNTEDLIKKMHNDKVVHLNDSFFDSEGRLIEPQTEGSDLVPTPNSSESKDTTTEPNNQEVEQKNVAAPEIPTLKNGQPDYNAMSEEMFVEQYVARFGEKNTENIARNNIKSADKAITDLGKKIGALTDPNKLPELQAKLDVELARKARYVAILDLLGLSENARESNSERVSRLKKENTDRIAQLFPDGLPNVESVILADIAGGHKMRWSDKVVNGAVVSRGLGAELGLADSNAERNRRVGLLSSEAPTPDEYAEHLRERLDAMGIRYEESELRDKVIDTYASVDTRGNAWKALESLAANQQTQEEALDYEEEQMRRAYEREQQKVQNTPDQRVDVSTEDAGHIGDEQMSTEDEVPFRVREYRSPLHDRVAEWENKLGIAVNVMESIDEVENKSAREAIQSGKRVTGWFEPSTGKVMIYMPFVRNIGEIDKTIIHEIVAHKGLRQLLGEEKFGSLMDRVWNVMSEQDQSKYIAYPGVNGDTRKAADEYMAFLAEGVDLTEQDKNVWQKVVDFFREILAGLGVDIQLSDADLEDLIRASYQNLVREHKEYAAQLADPSLRVSSEIDDAYMDAINAGDMELARKLVREYAESRGYHLFGDFRDAHAAPSSSVDKPDFTNAERINQQSLDEGWDVNLFAMPQGENLAPSDFWSPMGPRWYMYDNKAGRETHAVINSAIRSIMSQLREYGEVRNMPTVKVYRAVPNSVVVDSLENGDWVTPSITYATTHGLARFGEGEFRLIEQDVPATDLWWDGNDAREWGYDNGNVEAYANVKNHVKMLDPITRDDNGNIIPLSKRFDSQIDDIRFRFIGEKGAANLDKAEEATTRLDNLAVARQMDTSGKDAKIIKMATGWERGADQKWRYEENDIKMVSPEKWVPHFYGSIALEEVMEDSNGLFDAYPELRSIKIKRGKRKSVRGSYNVGKKIIRLNLDNIMDAIAVLYNPSAYRITKEAAQELYTSAASTLHGTLIHELQHAIQYIEGFALGADPKMAADAEKANELNKRLQATNDKAVEYNALSPEERRTDFGRELRDSILRERKTIKRLMKQQQLGSDGYKRVAGEVEARNVSARRNLPMAERLASLAEKTEDVARKDQIFIFDALAGESAQFRITYHGTPATFDRFDHSFVGNGEGNRVFGWGTYVTEEKGIGEWYAKVLTDPINEFIPERIAIVDAQIKLDRAEKFADMVRKDIQSSKDNIEFFEERIRNGATGYDLKEAQENIENSREVIRNNEQALKKAEANIESARADVTKAQEEYEKVKVRGNLYQVEIPDDNGYNYLSWEDRPTPKQMQMIALQAEKESLTDIFYRDEDSGELVFNGSMTSGELEYKDLERSLGSDKAASEFLSRAGFTGIKYFGNGSNPNVRNYVIFNDADLEIEDRTSFRVAPTFYSNAANAVLGIKQEKATPEQWLKMIEKNGGLKAGEDKWIGLSDWLKASDKKTLTKQEVLDYINENQIQIEETTYSSNSAVETTPEFKALQEEFNQLVKDYENEARRNLDEYEAELETKYNFTDVFDTTVLNSDESRAHASLSRAIDEAYNAAWADLVDRYGDDFEIAFWRSYDGIRVDNAEAASIMLGLPVDRPIYHLRGDYTTKGLEGNREIALTVPTIESWNTRDEVHFGDAGGGRAIAWVRFGETTDSDGKRVLVIDEVQSKRHQEGREKGYRAKEQSFNVQEAEQNLRSAVKEFNDYRDLLKRKYDYESLGGSIVERSRNFMAALSEEERNEFKRLNEQKANLERTLQAHREVEIGIDDITFTEHDGVIDASYGDYISTHVAGTAPAMMLQTLREQIRQDRIDNARRFDQLIPDAPFDKNWAELAMKRMLRYAAEEGFDKVAWTTGTQQAERYGLSKSIDYIEAKRNENGTYDLDVATVDDSHFVEERGISETRLSELVGKEIASSIVKETQENKDGKTTIEGDGLRIGGEGMKGFYDQILPSFMNKYGKKWGVKVQDVTLPNVEEAGRTMHSVDVTDSMRESVMQGQPMFRVAESNAERAEIERNAYDDAFAEVAAEYEALDKNDEGAMAAWRAKKRNVVQNHMQHITDMLGLPCEVFVINPYDEATMKEAHRRYIEARDRFAFMYGDGMRILNEIERNYDEFTKEIAGLSGAYAPQSNIAFYNIAPGGIEDKTNNPNVWRAILVHENTHRVIEMLGIDQSSLAELWDVARASFPKSCEQIEGAYKEESQATKGEEFLAYAVESRATSEHAEVFFGFLSGNNSISEVMASYKNSVSLVRKYTEDILNELRNGKIQRTSAERSTAGAQRGTGSREVLGFRGRPVFANSRANGESNRGIVADDDIRFRIADGQSQAPDKRDNTIANLRAKLRDQKLETREVAQQISRAIRKSFTSDLVDKMGKRQFDGIIKLIETTDSRKDLEHALARIEEVVLDIQLKNEADRFNKYLDLRVQGESPRGVSIAANVDDTTRQFITIIKENLNRPIQEVDALLEEQGGTLAERSGAQVLSYYQEADSYAHEVDDANKEIDNLLKENTELRKERLALNKQGRSAEAKEISKKINANKGLIDALKAEMVQSKKSQLYYLQFAADELQKAIEGGKEGFKGWVEEQQQHKQELVNMAWRDIRDGKKIPILDEQRPIWMKTKDKIRDFLFAPAYSFDYLLKMISVNAPNGEGALYDHFVRGSYGYVEARGQYYIRYEQFKRELDEKAREIFGKGYKEVLAESNKPLDAEVSISYVSGKKDTAAIDENKIREGASEVFSPTIGEVMYAYMLSKMADGRVKLERMGLSEDKIDALLKLIPDKYIAFADWIQEEFLPSKRKVYNATHLRVFGTQMAQIENYVPLRVKKDFVYEEFDGSKVDKPELPSSITGSIIKRKRNTLPIDLHTNALDLMLDHGQQMEHWNAFTQIVHDTNILLSNTQLRRALDFRNPGLSKKLKQAALIAADSYVPDTDRMEKIAVSLSKVAAASKIAFRLNTALKQVLSYPAFYAYSVHPKFWGYVTRNISPHTWPRNFMWALQNIPSFQERWLGRMAGDERLAQMTIPQLDKWIKSMGEYGMFANALVDALACANGAQAVYQYEKERREKLGFSVEEADRLAKIDAALAINKTQQSSEGLFLSRIQVDRTFFATMVSTFQNSNFAYLRKQLEGVNELYRDFRKEVDNRKAYYKDQDLNLSAEEIENLAIKDVVNAKKKAVMDILTFAFILNTMWTLGNGMWKYAFGDDDEEDNAMSAIGRGLLNSFTRNLSIGQWVETVAYSDYRDLNPSLLLSDFNTFIDRVEEIASGDVRAWDRTAAYIVASVTVQFGGGVDLNSFVSMVEGVQGMLQDGANVEDIMLFLNAPRSQAKFIAGPPREGETMDEYQKRQAWIERKITSKIDKKQLKKWARNYRAYHDAEILGVAYQRDKSGNVIVPAIEEVNTAYEAALSDIGITKAGRMADNASKENIARAIELDIPKKIGEIYNLEQSLKSMVELSAAYDEQLRRLQRKKQEMVDLWTK